VLRLNNQKETLEKREIITQEEIEKNPYVLRRAEKGSLEDFFDHVGTIGFRITIIGAIVVYVIYLLFF
jgi:preprotein translocase subunit Sss1